MRIEVVLVIGSGIKIFANTNFTLLQNLNKKNLIVIKMLDLFSIKCDFRTLLLVFS